MGKKLDVRAKVVVGANGLGDHQRSGVANVTDEDEVTDTDEACRVVDARSVSN